ncbi:MAG TPA: oligosaccharide flippase family protein, partial [Fervidobacterium sp.]|nr:oligosaccharide flippase family protein [Fervidobacterium sp.]
ALVGFGTWALVIRTIVGQVIQSVMLVTHNKWIPTLKFDIKSFKELFGFGWKILVSGLLNTIYENIYYPIIGKFFSATALGFFTNAQKMNDVPSKMLTQAVQKVTYPVLSQVQDDEVTLRNGFGKALRLISFVSFPLMLCLAAVGEPLIKVLVGEKWIPSVQYFQILCFSGMLYPIHSLNLNVLQVKGRSDLFLKLEIIKKIIGVVSIVLVLVLGLGISGLLWAQFVTSIISFFINSFYSKEMINYSMFDQIKDMSPIFLAAILAAGVAYSLMYFLHISDILLLLVQLITGLSTYVIACLLFKIDELHEMRDIYRLLVKP